MTSDATVDPGLASWIVSANTAGADFPIQNLPFGVVRPLGGTTPWRVGTAIGDMVLDLGGCAEQGLLDHAGFETTRTLREPALNALMALPPEAVSRLRAGIQSLLLADAPAALRSQVGARLLRSQEVEFAVPAVVGDYTDFYASINHATNVGRLLRPDNPLLPNYKHVPIGYHGRASTLVVSGAGVRRPKGQRGTRAGTPVFGPTQRLDFELEVGLFVGPGNAHGMPVPLEAAGQHLFGACLLNDWSARDIQAWEYQPLGPFLSKDFATSVSPWVVTRQALAPFRVAAAERDPADPPLLPYLVSASDRAEGSFTIDLEVLLSTDVMRRDEVPPASLARVNFRTMYWTPAQLIAHHTSNGCHLRPGDLLGSGTVSGTDRNAWGSLLELTFAGREPIQLATGETRGFLEDGDEVILRGSCAAPGAVRIGLGECRGRILPAVP